MPKKSKFKPVGALLRLQRHSAGKTQAEVSHILGMDQSTISGWELGKFVPKDTELEMLAIAYGCEIKDFFKADLAALSAVVDAKLTQFFTHMDPEDPESVGLALKFRQWMPKEFTTEDEIEEYCAVLGIRVPVRLFRGFCMVARGYPKEKHADWKKGKNRETLQAAENIYEYLLLQRGVEGNVGCRWILERRFSKVYARKRDINWDAIGDTADVEFSREAGSLLRKYIERMEQIKSEFTDYEGEDEAAFVNTGPRTPDTETDPE